MVHTLKILNATLKKEFLKHRTLPATSIAPNNGWLEYYFPIGGGQLQSEPPNNGKQHPDVVISGGDEWGPPSTSNLLRYTNATCRRETVPTRTPPCCDTLFQLHIGAAQPLMQKDVDKSMSLTLFLGTIHIPWKSKNEQRMVFRMIHYKGFPTTNGQSLVFGLPAETLKFDTPGCLNRSLLTRATSLVAYTSFQNDVGDTWNW